MNKRIKKLYLALFIVAVGFPCFFWLVLGKNINLVGGNYENRILASEPIFDVNTYESYPLEYEAYFNDNLPFRNKLVSLNSWINYSVFEVSTSNRVILGKEKWLFYGDVTDGNPVGDYEGTNSFSDEEISCMCEAALNVQNRLEDMGIQFAIIIPTNKERIYAKYMPDYYKYSENSRTDLLVEVLQNKNLNIINPKDRLLDLQSQYQLYYSYDTHWNQLGGYVSVCDILNMWGIETAGLTDLTILSSELKDNYHVSAVDDLANMLNLRNSVFCDEIEYEIEEIYDVDWSQITYDLTHFENKTATNNETVFLLGDSFRVAMIPSLCTYFSDVYVVHTSSYTHNMLEEIEPDYLIIEYVERHSMYLKEIEHMVFEQ